jgi:hypothetical protein
MSFGDKPQARNCPFTFYGQFTETPVPEKLMLELEHEIFDPSGISTVDPPKRTLSGVLISQSCGILYHFKESIGLRYVVFPVKGHSGVPERASAHGATAVMSLPVCHSFRSTVVLV